MTDPRINAINQMNNLSKELDNKMVKKNKEVSFKNTMKKYLKEANDLQVEADENIKKLIAGEDVDTHEVMAAVEKANLSFDLTMEIRNKMLEVYNKVMKTQV